MAFGSFRSSQSSVTALRGTSGQRRDGSEVNTRIADLTSHCDLAQRLQGIPSSARVRGLYFRSILQVLREAGRADEFEQLFGTREYVALGWYPATDFLTRLAVGGALLESPERVHQGMYRIGKRHAYAFCESLLGQLMIRQLANDPHRLLRQGRAARNQSLTFGRWTFENTGSRSAVVSMCGEYVWIESNLVGAAVGTFEAIGATVDVTCEIERPFEGKHHLSW